MQVDHRDGRFVVSCTFEERFIPKAAGFVWDDGARRWVTGSTGVAISMGIDRLTPRAVTALALDRELPRPEGMDYLPFQSEGISYALRRSRALIADQPGLGKGHPLSTPLLTPSGWTPIGDLQIGDSVIGWLGDAIPVTKVFNRGMLPVYTVTLDDGATIKCDGDHLWTICLDDGDGGRLMTVDTLRLISMVDRGDSISIPMLIMPANLNAKAFKVTPLIAGTDQGTSFASAHRPVFQDVTPYDVRDYALAAPHQAIDFLSGLVTATGRIRGEDGHIRIDLVRRPGWTDLVSTIKTCVRQLGGLCYEEHIFRRQRLAIYLPDAPARSVFGTTSPYAKVKPRFREYGGMRERKIVSIMPAGREFVRCISVEGSNNLYVAENFIVTHNTIQAVGLINALPEVRNALIIPPASLKKNWFRELNKWLVDKSLSVDVATGPEFPRSNIVIINYDILNRHRAKLRERQWDLVVPDEHHYAKNPDSGRTKELHGGFFKPKGEKKFKLEPIPAQRLLMLSGTPLPNRTSDLWTTVRAADPYGLGKDMYEFCKTYAGGYYGSFGEFIKDGEPTPERLRELNVLMKQRFMVRRMKKDVLTQLPEKIRQIVPLPADGLRKKIDEERKAMTDLLDAYEKMVGIRKDISDEDLVNAVFRIKPETWEKYAKMVDGDLEDIQLPLTRLAQVRQELALAKLPMVVEYARNLVEQGEKIGIFAYHRGVIQGLMEAFPDAAVIWGDTPMESRRHPHRTRQAQQDRYQEDKNCRVFIGQYTAAGVGWTLTQGNHFIAAELTFAPHELLQAEDRFHRIGSEIWDSVWAHHLVVEGSMDDSMVLKLVKKMELIEAALD